MDDEVLNYVIVPLFELYSINTSSHASQHDQDSSLNTTFSPPTPARLAQELDHHKC